MLPGLALGGEPVVTDGDGLIATAYRPGNWREVKLDNFPGLVAEAEPGRFGFNRSFSSKARPRSS